MSSVLTKGERKPQIAQELYHLHKNSMKEILRMGEFKYGGRKSEGYKHFRKKTMEVFYSQLNKIFSSYLKYGIIEDCGCGHSLESRDGYQPCQLCAGCGYRNSNYLNDAMAYHEGWSENPQDMIKQMVAEECERLGCTVEEYLYPNKQDKIVEEVTPV